MFMGHLRSKGIIADSYKQSNGTIYATVAGTAASGQDYGASSGTFTFADGETSKLITLNITR
ncbi:Calx-beta domain-containing protein [Paenibacillus sedimenti]|uniref:Calx-beta domain-containing protein n=1 Tax=Paenibacillus sedimenti TaxID=2770274 RepID=A0A926KQJ6_9BACL|nr:hypothetical protein [Paenibacillus sedimenti]MBD0381637.1 hypothetical protein [Paenibacillus sedimenti]